MPAVKKSAPALPPKIIGFRASLDSTAKVDTSAGTMKGVAVMTANLQPRGWPMWADEKSLDTLLAAFAALGTAKSYTTHDGAPYCDRQGREIGLFASYRKEGNVLRADFEALAAYRKHEAKDFDKLFELAEKAPASFGVSPIFEYNLVWVRTNGAEIPTELATYRYDSAADDYVPVFEPSAPADSKTALPCVRATHAYSIDFTDIPATNPGLFSAKPPVDASAKGVSPISPPSMHKQLFAKFRSNPAQFARATELHESDANLTFDAIVATVEREGTQAEIATLRADLGKRDGELATLRESVKTKDTEIDTLKTQTTKDAATIAAFRKGPAAGADHVPTGGNPADGGTTTDPVAKLREEIAALKGTDEATSRKRGELTAKLRELKNKKTAGFASMKLLRALFTFVTVAALFAIAIPRGHDIAGLAGVLIAILGVAAIGAALVPYRANGCARLTLTVSEITDDLIGAFVQVFPILTKMGLDFRGTTLKLNKPEIAHITSLPTASTFNAGSGGYGYGATSARTLLTDVSVTPDQHPTCPIYWEHLDQISDDKNKYGDAIRLTGYVLAKAVMDNICAGFTTRNFSKELVIATADFDYDKIATITENCNTQKMMPEGRVLIVNSAVATTLDQDPRITSKDYSGQQTGGKGIRLFRNVGGFELVQEYPDLPTNNGTALTGCTIEADDDLVTKAAHGLATGDPIIFSSLTGGVGLSTSTRYWAKVASSSTFKVCSTYALAVAGTGINITTDYSDATVTLSENLVAFAFDKRAIAVLAGIPDGFNSELIAQLNIPQVMSMTPVTNSESGMTMAGVSWQEVGTGKLLYTPTFIWGKGLGRQAGAASTANVLTDYAGLRIVSS